MKFIYFTYCKFLYVRIDSSSDFHSITLFIKSLKNY